ncbi:hypothetical protein CesoFtcFv8_018083 [Champsocephalus esox]|uniref:Uncharacterized protein n=1 Tax=Champsocephalus esox TaxID=159716 RepID=A0AAN8GM80_9TELE|nr:hypothetical protein CesoFtcFv8_018083 [Champsocephalus esox]
MTNAEVRKADTTGTAFGYLVHVSNHKTANAFGEAQLYLTVEEFGWMKRWLEIKVTRYFTLLFSHEQGDVLLSSVLCLHEDDSTFLMLWHVEQSDDPDTEDIAVGAR